MQKSRQTKIGQYFYQMEKDRVYRNQNTNTNINDSKKKQDKNSKEVQNKQQKSDQKDSNRMKDTDSQLKKDKKEGQIELQISGSQSSSISVPSSVQRRYSNPHPQQTSNINVKFYTNQIASIPNGDLIEIIHKKWWGNYSLLQSHHGFIQWLFPNSFQSRFNSMAKALSQQQAKQFRNNIQIAKRYVNSYIMMLQFYGIKLKDKHTGELTQSRKPKYQQRYYKTFLTSFHNHMRITRMLSSLVMCGFGRYAKQFSLFLGDQINKQGGNLSGLKKYGIYDRQWKQYSEYIEKQAETSIYLKNMKN